MRKIGCFKNFEYNIRDMSLGKNDSYICRVSNPSLLGWTQTLQDHSEWTHYHWKITEGLIFECSIVLLAFEPFLGFKYLYIIFIKFNPSVNQIQINNSIDFQITQKHLITILKYDKFCSDIPCSNYWVSSNCFQCIYTNVHTGVIFHVDMDTVQQLAK